MFWNAKSNKSRIVSYTGRQLRLFRCHQSHRPWPELPSESQRGSIELAQLPRSAHRIYQNRQSSLLTLFDLNQPIYSYRVKGVAAQPVDSISRIGDELAGQDQSGCFLNACFTRTHELCYRLGHDVGWW